MDPIESINFKIDSSISLIHSLQNKAIIKLIIPDSIYTGFNSVNAKVCDFYIDSINKNKYKLHMIFVISMKLESSIKKDLRNTKTSFISFSGVLPPKRTQICSPSP